MNINPETGNPMPQGSWFSKNWKWVVGLGCVLPTLCCGGSLALSAFGIFNAVKDNQVYMDAMTRVLTSPQVVEALGPPVTMEGLPSVSVQSRNGASHVELTLGAQGSKGKGKAYVTATQVNGGPIVYQRFELETDKGEKIDLRDESPPEPDPVDPSEPAPKEKPMPDQPEDE